MTDIEGSTRLVRAALLSSARRQASVAVVVPDRERLDVEGDDNHGVARIDVCVDRDRGDQGAGCYQNSDRLVSFDGEGVAFEVLCEAVAESRDVVEEEVSGRRLTDDRSAGS